MSQFAPPVVSKILMPAASAANFVSTIGAPETYKTGVATGIGALYEMASGVEQPAAKTSTLESKNTFRNRIKVRCIRRVICSRVFARKQDQKFSGTSNPRTIREQKANTPLLHQPLIHIHNLRGDVCPGVVQCIFRRMQTHRFAQMRVT